MLPKRKGFTLIELLVAMSILMLLMTSTTVLLFASLRASKRAATAAQAKEEGAYMMSLMTRLLQYARQVTCSGTEIDFVTLANKQTSFSIAAGKIASGSTTLNTIPARNLSFTCGANNLVTISLTMDDGTTLGIPFSSQVVLRNSL